MSSILDALRNLMNSDAQPDNPWHPPMPAPDARRSPWNPPMIMPNTPRDPAKDKRPPDSFLKGKSGADFGQDPFAEPLPDKAHMTKLNGAMRLPPPQRAAPMSPKDFGGMTLDDPKGLVPEGMSRADFTKEGPSGVGKNPDDDIVRVTPSSYFDVGAAKQPAEPSMSLPDLPEIGPQDDHSYEQTQPQPQSNPSSSGDSDWMNNPYAQQEQTPPARGEDDPRNRLKAYLERMNSQKIGPDGAGEMIRANAAQNSNLGLYALLNKSANMAGSINGNVASNQGIENYVAGEQANNNRMTDGMIASSKDQKSKTDAKLKGMMFLAKQAQDEEKYKDDLLHRGKQLDELTNYHQGSLKNQESGNALQAKLLDARLHPQSTSLNPLQQSQAELNRAKAKHMGDAPAAKEPGVQKYINEKVNTQAKRGSMINKMEASLQRLRSMPEGKDKDAYASSLLKMVNSPENPDAIGAEESDRMGYSLKKLRPTDLFYGKNPVGTDVKSFENLIDNQVKTMKANQKADADELRRVGGETAITRGTRSQAPAGKVRVQDKDGTILIIPEGRLQEALKDGAKEI